MSPPETEPKQDQQRNKKTRGLSPILPWDQKRTHLPALPADYTRPLGKITIVSVTQARVRRPWLQHEAYITYSSMDVGYRKSWNDSGSWYDARMVSWADCLSTRQGEETYEVTLRTTTTKLVLQKVHNNRRGQPVGHRRLKIRIVRL